MNDIAELLRRYPLHRRTVPVVRDGPDKHRRFMEASQFTRHAIFDPPYDFRTVVITGSNGKGSTASVLSAFLQKSNHRVGVISSPALRDNCTDMIRVNAKPIAAHRLLLGLKEAEAKLKPLVGSPELTHYMLICVAAYDYFRESNVDFVVAETAIGGLYDPTTPFAPDVCMFTNVTREHEDVLGDTSAKIAQHKSRIIGQDSEVVLGEEITDDVERVISSYALQQRASVRRVDVESATSTGMICDHGGVKIFNGNRFCPDYQHPNLRLAAEAFVALGAGGGNGLWIDLDDSPPGLFPENRFEFRSRNGVTYLFDSAHNEDGFAKFAQALGRFFDLRELSFFIGPFRKDVMDSFHRIVRPNRVTFVSGYHPRVRKRDGFADLYSVDFDAEEYRIGNGAIVVLGMFLPAMVKAMLFPDERADTLAKYKGADGC